MSNKCLVSNPSQRGFSLLELIFALAVGAMIILFAAGRYQQSKWDRNLVVTQRSVQTLLQALNHYFYLSCNDEKYETLYKQVSVPVLVASGLLPTVDSPLIANPFGQPFVVEIFEVANILNRPIYQLKLTAKYPSITMANSLRQQLGANAGSGAELIWTRLPSSSQADPSSAYWIQSDAFNQGATDGLRAYVKENPNKKLFIGVCNNRGPKPSSP
jgi:prepilin-type N-terminal cleavage/methylation domain-containing protein